MRIIKKVFDFNTLFLPKLVQIFFILLTLISIISAIIVSSKNFWFSLFLLVMPLFLRVIAEWFIIPFKQFEVLKLIQESIKDHE